MSQQKEVVWWCLSAHVEKEQMDECCPRLLCVVGGRVDGWLVAAAAQHGRGKGGCSLPVGPSGDLGCRQEVAVQVTYLAIQQRCDIGN